MKREGRRAEGERKGGIQDEGPGKGERRQERFRARIRRAVVVKDWMKSSSLWQSWGEVLQVTPLSHSKASSRHWLAGVVGSCSGRSRPVGSTTTGFIHGYWGSPVLIFKVVTPHFRKVRFSLSPMPGLASLPSPLTHWGPTPNSFSAKGKINSISKLPVPLCHVWAKAASKKLRGGVGAGVKTLPPARSPIGVGCWNLGEKEKRKVNQESPPGFLWIGVGPDRCCLLVSS